MVIANEKEWSAALLASGGSWRDSHGSRSGRADRQIRQSFPEFSPQPEPQQSVQPGPDPAPTRDSFQLPAIPG